MLAALGQLTQSLVEPFGGLDFRFAAVALAFQAANLVLRSFAWRNVLAAAFPSRHVPVVGVGAAYAAGVALNAYLPARGGEAVKVGLVRLQLPGASLVTIAASGSVILALDALLGGGLLVGAWAFGVLPAVPRPPHAVTALSERPLFVVAGAALLALGAWFAVRKVNRFARHMWEDVLQGGAVLRSPRRYLQTVVSLQLGAWACRIGFVLALLAAFGLPASLPLATVVVVLGGLSTVVPAAPGGAGAQQLLVVYGLHGAVSASAALSFSVLLQVAVTAMNTTIGIAAAMLVLRTLHPLVAVRSGLTARSS